MGGRDESVNLRDVEGDCMCKDSGGPLDDVELSMYMSDGAPETVCGAIVIEVEEEGGSSRKNESLGLREVDALGADDRPV
jgi:hypothetical protein